MTTLRSKYWTYYPKFLPSYVFEPLLDVIQDYCRIGQNKNRTSCVFYITNKHKNNLYTKIPTYNWDQAPSILPEILKLTQQYTKEKYDYVLVHIYWSGLAGIGYHRDDEALYNSVASISLGATRKFRFKKLDRRNGWDVELHLTDGDLVWMHGPNVNNNILGCQQVYLHTIPVERKVKKPRINLTFRQF